MCHSIGHSYIVYVLRLAITCGMLFPTMVVT